jgi:non-homologous end joining protein Ku
MEAPADSSGKIIDLMEALKASLSQKPAEEPDVAPKKKGRKAS